MITHAFLDAQNIHQAVRQQGWQYDFRKLRIYLRDKYGVDEAFFFIGMVPRNHRLYQLIQQAGYTLMFKEVAVMQTGEIKGNVDVNLTLHAATTLSDYDEAVLVSADGDFSPLVQYWQDHDKFRAILSPATQSRTSKFLKRDAAGRIDFMSEIRGKIER